jgi:hypothetical protein
MYIELLLARKIVFKKAEGGGFTKSLREVMNEEGASSLLSKVKTRQ